ncbi:hypothetical protein HMPREF1208_01658 [Staphylococcus sp. HGB0015]|uniref:PadR family transcriptional regulator n=1 Tax=Staphylococcus TaxID=1279 RepID=UPI00034E3017|nr:MULTISPECIES: PadR family transcriptional regulator [Staphylococcus]EPD49310.1 hypothetical protein HMPREF1208_01658 [Staphylococcus sp. HGB0015]
MFMPHQQDGFDRMFDAHQRRDRFFKKGNLQFLILRLLMDSPKHGYQIIKDLEAQFKGFYSPSPGSVYPILQMLEDREFVSTSKEGKKKVYTITDEGIEFLKEQPHYDEYAKRMGQFKEMDTEKLTELRSSLQSLFRSFMLAGQHAMKDEKQLADFEQFIQDTAKQLESFKEKKDDEK